MTSSVFGQVLRCMISQTRLSSTHISSSEIPSQHSSQGHPGSKEDVDADVDEGLDLSVTDTVSVDMISVFGISPNPVDCEFCLVTSRKDKIDRIPVWIW